MTKEELKSFVMSAPETKRLLSFVVLRMEEGMIKTELQPFHVSLYREMEECCPKTVLKLKFFFKKDFYIRECIEDYIPQDYGQEMVEWHGSNITEKRAWKCTKCWEMINYLIPRLNYRKREWSCPCDLLNNEQRVEFYHLLKYFLE